MSEARAIRLHHIAEDGTLLFLRNEQAMSDYSRTTRDRLGKPPFWRVSFPHLPEGRKHTGILQNFVDTIRGDAELIAPAAEGMASVELGNAMLLSSLKGQPIDLPLDAGEFEARLNALIETSKHKQP